MGLLEYLAGECGCTYLSDMRSDMEPYGKLSKLLGALQGISPERYSMSEWREATAYLTGKNAAASTPAACRDALTRSLVERANKCGSM